MCDPQVPVFPVIALDGLFQNHLLCTLLIFMENIFMKFIMYLSIIRTPLTLETLISRVYVPQQFYFLKIWISAHLLPHLSVRKGSHHFAVCNEDSILGTDVPGGNL